MHRKYAGEALNSGWRVQDTNGGKLQGIDGNIYLYYQKENKYIVHKCGEGLVIFTFLFIIMNSIYLNLFDLAGGQGCHFKIMIII